MKLNKIQKIFIGILYVASVAGLAIKTRGLEWLELQESVLKLYTYIVAASMVALVGIMLIALLTGRWNALSISIPILVIIVFVGLAVIVTILGIELVLKICILLGIVFVFHQIKGGLHGRKW